MERFLFCFPNTEAGLELALHTTLSQRQAGNKTRLIEQRVAGFTLQVVEVTPRPRPTRRERGLFVR